MNFLVEASVGARTHLRKFFAQAILAVPTKSSLFMKSGIYFEQALTATQAAPLACLSVISNSLHFCHCRILRAVAYVMACTHFIVVHPVCLFGIACLFGSALFSMDLSYYGFVKNFLLKVAFFGLQRPVRRNSFPGAILHSFSAIPQSL